MKLRKITSYLICLFATFVFAMLFSSRNVNALPDTNANKLTYYKVDQADNKVYIAVQYQFGITDLQVYICNTKVETACVNGGYVTKYLDPSLLYEKDDLTGVETNVMINPTDYSVTYDNNAAPYSTPHDGIALDAYGHKYDENGKPANLYYIMVRARFCLVRTEDKTGCYLWDDDTPYVIFTEQFNMSTGLTASPEINNTLSQMLYIVNSIVIPILWAILGLLLIIRGIMLGMEIVKSADEPEVRKKKVQGLVWLFIGVFVGFVITGVASAVMSMFGIGGIFS